MRVTATFERALEAGEIGVVKPAPVSVIFSDTELCESNTIVRLGNPRRLFDVFTKLCVYFTDYWGTEAVPWCRGYSSSSGKCGSGQSRYCGRVRVSERNIITSILFSIKSQSECLTRRPHGPSCSLRHGLGATRARHRRGARRAAPVQQACTEGAERQAVRLPVARQTDCLPVSELINGLPQLWARHSVVRVVCFDAQTRFESINTLEKRRQLAVKFLWV